MQANNGYFLGDVSSSSLQEKNLDYTEKTEPPRTQRGCAKGATSVHSAAQSSHCNSISDSQITLYPEIFSILDTVGRISKFLAE